ncbi:MAG: hypothetical protein AB1349_13740, partial [Elusimicrobiota bacterium]
FIQNPDFEEYNWIRKDRLRKSKFPPPPKELLKNVMSDNSHNDVSQQADNTADNMTTKCHTQFNLTKSNLSKYKLNKYNDKKRGKYEHGIPKELQR